MPGFPGDFSIADEFANLKPGHYVPMICEGYGFSGITNDSDECKVVYMDFDEPNNPVKAIVPLDELDAYWEENVKGK